MGRPLAIFSCIHIGDPNSREELFVGSLKSMDSVGADMIFIGDLINNGQWYGTKHVGSTWDDKEIPDVQKERAITLLKPFRKRIRRIISGNHSGRTRKATSFDPEIEIARRLGIPYGKPSGIYRHEGISVFLAHGVSGADFKKVLAGWSHVDVIAIGHTHQLYWEKVRRVVVSGTGRQTLKETSLIRCGTYLDQPRYAMEALYPPTPLGHAVILPERNGQIQVKLGVTTL